jgi:hypothetical protein
MPDRYDEKMEDGASQMGKTAHAIDVDTMDGSSRFRETGRERRLEAA